MGSPTCRQEGLQGRHLRCSAELLFSLKGQRRSPPSSCLSWSRMLVWIRLGQRSGRSYVGLFRPCLLAPGHSRIGTTMTLHQEPLMLRGRELLAEGYCAMLFVLKSDLDFLSNHFQLNSPASNSPCALCQCDRDMGSRPWTDCRPAANWRDTCWGAEDWAAVHPSRHTFFKMAGSGLDLIYPDLMHCKHLGTDLSVMGSVLTWLIKHYLKGSSCRLGNDPTSVKIRTPHRTWLKGLGERVLLLRAWLPSSL